MPGSVRDIRNAIINKMSWRLFFFRSLQTNNLSIAALKNKIHQHKSTKLFYAFVSTVKCLLSIISVSDLVPVYNGT